MEQHNEDENKLDFIRQYPHKVKTKDQEEGVLVTPITGEMNLGEPIPATPVVDKSEQLEKIKSFMEWSKTNRHFYVDQVRGWLKRLDDEEISFSKFVELFNETVFERQQSSPSSARQMAVEFAEWIDGNRYNRIPLEDRYAEWTDGNEVVADTTDQLYSLFKGDTETKNNQS